MFFVFFGTNLPFQTKSGGGIEEMVESNIINQIVFTILFFLALVTLIPKKNFLVSFIKEEKFFFIFIMWCAATIFWSDFALISLKRYFQFLTIVLVILSVIAYVNETSDLLKIIRYLLISYLIISIVTIVLIPGAIDQFGSFRGIAPSKNNFGQMIIICIILWGTLFSNGNLKEKVLYFSLLTISLALIFGSRSATSIIIVLFVLLLNILLKINKEFEFLGFGKFFFYLIIVFVIVLFSVIVVSFTDVLNEVFGGMGKDITLTGRTDIWIGVLENARSYIFIGCGYQSFWISENPFLDEWYQTYYWIPLQSHSGYIDIINELGVIGFTIFIFWIINFFKSIFQLKNVSFFIWIFISGLVLNLTESSIIRARNPFGVMMIFSYLVLQKKYNAFKHSDSNRLYTSI